METTTSSSAWRKAVLLSVVFGQFFLQALSFPLGSGSNSNSNSDSDDAFDQTFLENLPGYHSNPESTATSIDDYPSWFTSTLLARRLLALSTTGSVSTAFPDPLPSGFPYSHVPPDVAGHSISLKEYISDCDEYLFSGTSSSSISSGGRSGRGAMDMQKNSESDRGNPIFLALNIATTFRNVATGSKNVSLSIDWWDHLKDTEPIYPGFPLSPAGLPRVTLLGYVEPLSKSKSRNMDVNMNMNDNDHANISPKTEKMLEKCYLDDHPDAKVWLPGRKGSPHSSFWARLVVTHVYWIGGFGDVARIGWLDVGDWKGIEKEGSGREVGDGSGRGWDDVRLPGENE